MRGRLGRVHNEVAQREAEPLGRSTQEHSFGSRPGELLFCVVRPRRRAGQVAPFWGFILHRRKESVGKWKYSCFHFYFKFSISEADLCPVWRNALNSSSSGVRPSRTGFNMENIILKTSGFKGVRCDFAVGQYISLGCMSIRSTDLVGCWSYHLVIKGIFIYVRVINN